MPRLSIIFLSLDGGASLRKVLSHLSAHRLASQMEIVVAIGEDADLALNPPPVFAGFQVVRSAPARDIGTARAAAVRASSAEFVFLGEDHSFPVEGWAEALLTPLESGASGAGPKIQVANPVTSTSWSDAILSYGDFLCSQAQPNSTRIPWHNSAYRREPLVAFGDQLEFLLQADSLVQGALVEQGHRFAIVPEAATDHFSHSLLGPHLLGLYWGNRLYGATRAMREHWTVSRRWFYAASLPAIVALRLWRALQVSYRLDDRHIRRVTLLPLLAIGSIVGGWGETWGYLFGLGPNTLRRRSYSELNRVLHVQPSEVSLLRD